MVGYRPHVPSLEMGVQIQEGSLLVFVDILRMEGHVVLLVAKGGSAGLLVLFKCSSVQRAHSTGLDSKSVCKLAGRRGS